MIADLKPYPEYKESGLPWLGQVPGHWTTRVLKRLCYRSALYGANIPASDYVSAGVRFLRTTDITDEGTLRRGGVFVAEADANNYMLSDGDLLVSRSGTIGRSLRYRAELHGPCAYAGYLVRFVPAPVALADYLFCFTKSIAFAEFIRVSAVSSTIENVNGDKYANMPVPLPPPPEQAAIVRFLDWANGRLERAIRAKRKVIALLGEQKQAIIHRAVTRGLDPSVPLKDSGIPWLGEIPEHWEVSRIKNEFRCLNTQRVPLNSVERGAMSARTYDYYGASGVIDKVDEYLFDDELLLIAEDGANLVLRNLPLAIIASGRFWVNNHAHILKPKRGNIVYLANLLETLNFLPWISGAAQPKLTQDRLLSITIAVAPSEEQDVIVHRSLQETGPLITAISRLTREIELLREYRTRLVADVVTGKLDVREVAARLPDEVPLDVVEEDANLGLDPEADDEEGDA